MYCRGNLLLRKLSFCSDEIKVSLFCAYCYSTYGYCLWAKYRVAMIQRIKVCYNTIFRSFFGIPPFISPRSKFVELYIMSYGENIRQRMHSMLLRLQSSKNSLIRALTNSDAYVKSLVLARYREQLFTCPPASVFPCVNSKILFVFLYFMFQTYCFVCIWPWAGIKRNKQINKYLGLNMFGGHITQ